MLTISVSNCINTNLHKKLISSLMNASLPFFTKNRNGRIFTRFSKDAVVLDTMLFSAIVTILYGFFRGLFAVISVAVINPFTLIAFAVSAVLMAIYLKLSLRVLTETSRLESSLRTPVHDAFIELINGIVTLRAYGKRTMFYR